MKLFEHFRTKGPEQSRAAAVTNSGSHAPAKWGRERLAFYGRFFGQRLGIAPEMVPHANGIEVVTYGPQQGRNFYTLITNGMSDRIMPPPPNEADAPRRIEIFMRVPEVQVTSTMDDMPWQLKLLLKVASCPWQNGKWLGAFQQMTNGNPPKPICPGSQLVSSILLPPLYENPAFAHGMTTHNGPHIDFLLLDFLTANEAAYLQANGKAALLRLLESKRHTPVLNVKRASYF